MPTTTQTANEESVRHTLEAIAERANTDRPFREKLISDPHSAMAEFAGVSADKMPKVSIAFVESEAETTVVLPPFGKSRTELSDSQLETVSGGTDPVTAGLVIGICFLAGVDTALLAYDIGLASRK
ncbi:MAG TPA: hypothetical protein VN706_16010 [Gemmatimonadaceae bacterium]|nr:hypothetical protein [Gemmatimonadaceae bacterium]